MSYHLNDDYDGEGAAVALATVRALMQGAPRHECLKEIARLRIKTSAARLGDCDMDLVLEIYADELTCYPLDIVREVCRAYPTTSGGKWFPAWAELQELCQRQMLKRRCLERALASHCGEHV